MEFSIETPPPPEPELVPIGGAVLSVVIAVVLGWLFLPMVQPFVEPVLVLLPQLIDDPAGFERRSGTSVLNVLFLIGLMMLIFGFIGWQVWRLVSTVWRVVRQRTGNDLPSTGLVEGVHWGPVTARLTPAGIEIERALHATCTRWSAFSNAALEDKTLRLETPTGYKMFVEAANAPGGPGAALAFARQAIARERRTP